MSHTFYDRRLCAVNAIIVAPFEFGETRIESYVSNSHIGFDPNYECHKTGLTSNGTSINRITLLVVGIEQKVERELFDVCLMFQNCGSREQTGSCFPSPQTEHSNTIFFLLHLFVKYSR